MDGTTHLPSNRLRQGLPYVIGFGRKCRRPADETRRTVLYVSSSAVVQPAANPVSTVNSRSSDTNPVPSALTLTRPVRRLLFTYGVPSCVVALDLLKPKFPLQDRHFRAFGRRVANGRVKEAG
jgi:hypothetical protein